MAAFQNASESSQLSQREEAVGWVCDVDRFSTLQNFVGHGEGVVQKGSHNR